MIPFSFCRRTFRAVQKLALSTNFKLSLYDVRSDPIVSVHTSSPRLSTDICHPSPKGFLESDGSISSESNPLFHSYGSSQRARRSL